MCPQNFSDLRSIWYCSRAVLRAANRKQQSAVVLKYFAYDNGCSPSFSLVSSSGPPTFPKPPAPQGQREVWCCYIAQPCGASMSENAYYGMGGSSSAAGGGGSAAGGAAQMDNSRQQHPKVLLLVVCTSKYPVILFSNNINCLILILVYYVPIQRSTQQYTELRTCKYSLWYSYLVYPTPVNNSLARQRLARN